MFYIKFILGFKHMYIQYTLATTELEKVKSQMYLIALTGRLILNDKTKCENLQFLNKWEMTANAL